jgi:uncharacterized membrane protein YfcA
MTLYRVLAMFAASFAAGAINSVAGGGTLLTFPVLIWLGLDPKVANATSTVALWPGLLGGVWGYRREVKKVQSLLLPFGLTSLVGGAVGASLLILTPSAIFAQLVPFLILFATVLFTVQEPISRWLKSRKAEGENAHHWMFGAMIAQFFSATYGGYFGAGNGIVMLAILGLLGVSDIHQANGLKNFLGLSLNIVAIIFFIIAGLVYWPDAVVMAAAAITGGYGGAHMAQRLGRTFVRRLVIGIGFSMGLLMLWRLYPGR